MIVVQLNGRLGNQMFQYAAARSLAERLGTSVEVDVASYCNLAAWTEYKLWRFPALRLRSFFPQLTRQFTSARSRDMSRHVMKGLGFDPVVNQLSDWTRLEGWFTSERYFADFSQLIRSLFDLSIFLSPDDVDFFETRLVGRTAVSVHIRRGDYVGDSLFNVGDLDDYYRNCFTSLMTDVPDAYFLVFSDDPDWCLRWQLLDNFGAHVVRDFRPRSPFRDMALMAWCRHHIMGNSTFGWWGSWLGSNPLKRVYMPSRWLDRWTSAECGLSVPGWIEITP